METKNHIEGFSTVKFFRTEKERIAKETSEMTFLELKEYLKNSGDWLKNKKVNTQQAV